MAAASRESFITMETPSPTTLWHTPVPYLFGALAAVSSLIAIALLIIACSYCWNVSASVLNGHAGAARAADMESARGKGGDGRNPPPPTVFQDKMLVIMAGEVNPSFIATPMSLGLDCSKVTCSREMKATAAEHGGADQLPMGLTSSLFSLG
ncbi:protein GLUTAMINE DUMPER 5-like [Cucurbita pepo subsp. pepo]|uniref:protein GLUTAMINE DUMPER 5-like n=1 Tax=Cucurbita pepo subsp. pepo TaxID=3664 RepID=UPI000C9D5D27|nr:protein GLUTAMINE DUMPER 5-like [Cucurbita pepo subsp. pepo]